MLHNIGDGYQYVQALLSRLDKLSWMNTKLMCAPSR